MALPVPIEKSQQTACSWEGSWDPAPALAPLGRSCRSGWILWTFSSSDQHLLCARLWAGHRGTEGRKARHGLCQTRAELRGHPQDDGHL